MWKAKVGFSKALTIDVENLKLDVIRSTSIFYGRSWLTGLLIVFSGHWLFGRLIDWLIDW